MAAGAAAPRLWGTGPLPAPTLGGAEPRVRVPRVGLWCSCGRRRVAGCLLWVYWCGWGQEAPPTPPPGSGGLISPSPGQGGGHSTSPMVGTPEASPRSCPTAAVGRAWTPPHGALGRMGVGWGGSHQHQLPPSWLLPPVPTPRHSLTILWGEGRCGGSHSCGHPVGQGGPSPAASPLSPSPLSSWLLLAEAAPGGSGPGPPQGPV